MLDYGQVGFVAVIGLSLTNTRAIARRLERAKESLRFQRYGRAFPGASVVRRPCGGSLAPIMASVLLTDYTSSKLYENYLQ